MLCRIKSCPQTAGYVQRNRPTVHVSRLWAPLWGGIRNFAGLYLRVHPSIFLSRLERTFFPLLFFFLFLLSIENFSWLHCYLFVFRFVFRGFFFRFHFHVFFLLFPFLFFLFQDALPSVTFPFPVRLGNRENFPSVPCVPFFFLSYAVIQNFSRFVSQIIPFFSCQTLHCQAFLFPFPVLDG
jgi:hypothetical protein